APGAARLASGRGPAALELRRPLADPLAAVRAFGDVRADLRPAVLADDEEISSACHRAASDDTYLQRCGGHDLGHDLAQIVVGLVDDDLARRPVAVRQQVLDAGQGVD